MIEDQYRFRLAQILNTNAKKSTKIALLEALAHQLRTATANPLTQAHNNHTRCNYEVLSTSMTSFSQGNSINFQLQTDIGELQERILKLRMVKFENNQEVETSQEELFEMEKVVKARNEYHDHLKRQIDSEMQRINSPSPNKKHPSVLNKSIGTVAGILNFKWWH